MTKAKTTRTVRKHIVRRSVAAVAVAGLAMGAVGVGLAWNSAPSVLAINMTGPHR